MIENASEMAGMIEKIGAELRRVVLGKDEVVEYVLTAILSRGHVLLEDVPGVGKTTLAMAFAKVLGLDSRRVQFTPDTMPSDIVGFSVYDPKTGGLQYKAGAIMTHLLLADEINRTSAKTQSALLEAMEESRVTVDGTTYALPEPFVVLATQNPVGSSGTQMLPNSQLDRFMVKLSMGYPEAQEQIEILKSRHHENPLDKVVAVTDTESLGALIAASERIYVSDPIYTYVTDLVEETRRHPLVQLGISPRGALALCRAAKSRALIRGRDYVMPEDVRELFFVVCGHRLLLSSKARLHEQDEGSILHEIFTKVAMPVYKKDWSRA